LSELYKRKLIFSKLLTCQIHIFSYCITSYIYVHFNLANVKIFYELAQSNCHKYSKPTTTKSELKLSFKKIKSCKIPKLTKHDKKADAK